MIVFSFAFTPNQGSMALDDVNPGESTNEVSSFVCGKLGAQLGNLRGIAWLCASHLSIHKPKENDNDHKHKPDWGTKHFL